MGPENSRIVKSGLSEALLANGLFSNECLVLSKTENSDLLEVSKECSREFFERLFEADGPLWRTYEKTRTGYLPFSSRHLNFIASRMYFCRNVEKRFLRSQGRERKFECTGESVVEKIPFTLDNFALLASTPFDALGQVLDAALLPLYVDEKLRGFPEFRERSIGFLERNMKVSLETAPEVAKEALEHAVSSMEFSFVSSLALAFNSKIAESAAWKECDAEKMFSGYVSGNLEQTIREQGFHSSSPYDISSPRIYENPEQLRLAAQPFPVNKYARWRENAKFCCSRYLCVMRRAYLEIGRGTGLGGLVFHLKTNELGEAIRETERFGRIARERQGDYKECLSKEIPSSFVFDGRVWHSLGIKPHTDEPMQGVPAGALAEAEGAVAFVNSEEDYLKDVEGRIIVSRTFSPTLAVLLKNAKALVSESGGVLAHSAIIAREVGIPCVVQAKGLGALREGEVIRVDGKRGKIERR